MMVSHFRFLFFILLCSVLLSNCISTRKYWAEVNNLESNYNAQLKDLNVQLDSTNQVVDSLVLLLARKNGEIDALLTVQDRLQGRIDAIQDQLKNVNNQAMTRMQSLDKTIQSKEADLEKKEEQFNDLRAFLTEADDSVKELAEVLEDSLRSLMASDLASANIINGRLHINISEISFFRKGRHRLSDSGFGIVEKISELLSDHPDKDIAIVGHTDNTKPNSRLYADNWELSVLQATSVAKTLIDEFGFNPNQISVGG